MRAYATDGDMNDHVQGYKWCDRTKQLKAQGDASLIKERCEAVAEDTNLAKGLNPCDTIRENRAIESFKSCLYGYRSLGRSINVSAIAPTGLEIFRRI